MRYDRTSEKVDLTIGDIITVPQGYFPDGQSRPRKLGKVIDLRAGMIWFEYFGQEGKIKTIPVNGSWEKTDTNKCEKCGYADEPEELMVDDLGQVICLICYQEDQIDSYETRRDW